MSRVLAFLTVLGLLLAVLGCSVGDSASAQPAATAPSGPTEIQPTWTPVRLPDSGLTGVDGYITQFCFDGSWLVLAYARTYGALGPLSVAYGGTRC